MQPIDAITQTFARCRAAGRAALMPYFTLGYPDPVCGLELVQAIAESGADLIELGVPFSDPLADGKTVQHSTQVALQQGMTVRRCFEQVRAIRAAGVRQPLLLMGYVNPILTYGLDEYVAETAAAGANGLIVPDLPVEEAAELEAACRRQGLALVYMLAPTSTPERIAQVAAHSSGFIYLVSVAGVTGARSQLSVNLADFVAQVRQVANLPLAVGFGISTPQHARTVGQFADGVIIGSALIDQVDRADQPIPTVRQYLGEVSAALAV